MKLRYTVGGATRFAFLALLFATLGFAGGVFAERESIKTRRIEGRFHTLIVPEIGGYSATTCSVEEAAYYAALVDLEDAEQAADEAYEAWYECEIANGGGYNIPWEEVAERQPATFSILER